MKLSARNQLKGKVVSINNGAVNSIVSIDIGGGNIITATISCAAVEELNLKVGSDASVKILCQLIFADPELFSDFGRFQLTALDKFIDRCLFDL